MEVVIRNPEQDDVECRLGHGDTLVFGRGVGGVGEIGEDPTVSRLHGQITVTALGFSVEATGTFAGVTVTDLTTPSRLHIPHGVGAIEIPFRESAITIESDSGPSQLEVSVVGSRRADAWASQWGIDAPPRQQPPRAARPRTLTSAPGRYRNTRRYRKSNGVYYSWFTVLVALCEPALFGEQDVAVAPTNAQLARRSGFSVSTIEKKLNSIYEALEVDTNDRPRDVAIRRAIGNGIVTRDHLALLTPRPRRLG